MKIAVMIGVVCIAMLACGGGERLREAENQLSIAEERLAAYEDAAATAAARYECNMKTAVALLAVGNVLDKEKYGWDAYRDMGAQTHDDLWDFVEQWRDSSLPLLARYVRAWVDLESEYALDIWEVVGDLRSGEC